MLQLQHSSAFLPGTAQLQPVEFAYEPVFLARTRQILAYEQLARRPGGFDASFLSELSAAQCRDIDSESIEIAAAAVNQLGAPVFVNAFPENIERLAQRLSRMPKALSSRIGLEVNEDVGLERLINAIKTYPDLWWIVDDLDMRKDALATLAHPQLRRQPLTVKFHYQCAINDEHHSFDLTMLPSHWMTIVEGVKPHHQERLKARGVLFMQGRDLGCKEGNVTGRTLLI